MTPLPEKYRYIVVEGPIGAGKTSLARMLAEKSGSTPLLEDPGANPFLPGFYQDSARYALPTQLFFLFQRVNQVRDLTQADLFRRATVADFILDKDPLFARLTLNDDELSLYQQIYAQLKPQAAVPDLVIYLQASTETLIERVKRRAVSYERAISEDLPVAARGELRAVFLSIRRIPRVDREFGTSEFCRHAGRFRFIVAAHNRDARRARILQPWGVTGL